MSIGERTPVALVDFAASARMAVGEALTNIACSYVQNLKRVKLSATGWQQQQHRGRRVYMKRLKR